MPTVNDLAQALYDAAQDYVRSLPYDVDQPDPDHDPRVEASKVSLRDAAVRFSATAREPGLAAFLQRISDAVDALNHAQVDGATTGPQVEEAQKRILAAAVAVISEWRGDASKRARRG